MMTDRGQSIIIYREFKFSLSVLWEFRNSFPLFLLFPRQLVMLVRLLVTLFFKCTFFIPMNCLYCFNDSVYTRDRERNWLHCNVCCSWRFRKESIGFVDVLLRITWAQFNSREAVSISDVLVMFYGGGYCGHIMEQQIVDDLNIFLVLFPDLEVWWALKIECLWTCVSMITVCILFFY